MGEDERVAIENLDIQRKIDQGWQSFEQGFSLTSNPYPGGSREHEWWNHGWMSGKYQDTDIDWENINLNSPARAN